MAKTAVTMEEVVEVIEQAVAAEEARQASVQDNEPVTTRTYTVHATHPPQAIALNNKEGRGIVAAINCTGPCRFTLRDGGGKALIDVDAPDGFDTPLAIAFAGPLVAELKTASSISFTIIY